MPWTDAPDRAARPAVSTAPGRARPARGPVLAGRARASRPSSSRSPARWSWPRCRDGADRGGSSGLAAREREWHSFAVATTAARALAGTASSYGAQGTGHSGSPATSRMGTPGIGPVLPYLMGRPPVQFECLWIGRCHRAAMGTDLVDRVLADGPVTLIDTSSGRPDVGRASPGRCSGSTPCSWSAMTWCGQRRPSVRGAGGTVVRSDLRLIGHARPRVPASPCPFCGSASRGLVSHRQIGSGPLPASPLWPGCAPESSRVVQTRAARR